MSQPARWRRLPSTTVGHNRTFPLTLQVVNNTLVRPQQWKLWVCSFAAALIAACQFAPAWVANLVGGDVTNIKLLGLVGAFLLLSAASLSIRCPACGLALAWHGMRRQPVSKWLTWLLGVKVCPRCGFSHEPLDRGK